MREFFVLVNEYPWTTFFLFCALVVILEIVGATLATVIRK